MRLGILFDLDGTLLDTLGDIQGAVNYTMRQFGLPEKTREEVRGAIGHGILHILQKVSAGTGADPQELVQVYKPYYDAHCLDTTRPYPGVMEMLKALSARYPVAVVSNKLDDQTKAICTRFFPGVYALGQREGVPVKPAPDMLHIAMKELGISRGVFVGDSDTDVLSAKNAGLPCLSVLWGFQDREYLASVGATHFCQTAEDILKWMENYEHGQ